uniref:Uncharacterized protein n=1 Tax=Glossina palpalis gambiensis TaxID=67801 RepID=A0A1B0B0G2_9MUSC
MHASSKKKYIKIMRFIRHAGSSQQLTKIYLKGFHFISLYVMQIASVTGSVLERANLLLNGINSSKLYMYTKGMQLTSDLIFKSWCIVFFAAKRECLK